LQAGWGPASRLPLAPQPWRSSGNDPAVLALRSAGLAVATLHRGPTHGPARSSHAALTVHAAAAVPALVDGPGGARACAIAHPLGAGGIRAARIALRSVPDVASPGGRIAPCHVLTRIGGGALRCSTGAVPARVAGRVEGAGISIVATCPGRLAIVGAVPGRGIAGGRVPALVVGRRGAGLR